MTGEVEIRPGVTVGGGHPCMLIAGPCVIESEEICRRIAGSVNVSAQALIDRETGAYLPADVLSGRFRDIGASEAQRVITYCGGGIAATSDALVLTLLGHENVAVYDGSLSEWARDESLPMEVG